LKLSKNQRGLGSEKDILSNVKRLTVGAATSGGVTARVRRPRRDSFPVVGAPLRPSWRGGKPVGIHTLTVRGDNENCEIFQCVKMSLNTLIEAAKFLEMQEKKEQEQRAAEATASKTSPAQQQKSPRVPTVLIAASEMAPNLLTLAQETVKKQPQAEQQQVRHLRNSFRNVS
jgi:hypothetical protein